jgi:hypothetical protein
MRFENELADEAAVIEHASRGAEHIGPPPLEFSGALTGTLSGFARDGEALVDFLGNPTPGPLRARACVLLRPSDIGKDAVIVFDGGNYQQPIVIGLVQPSRADTDITAGGEIASTDLQHVELDGRRVELTAKETITLRCGEASITLSKDGKIVIRGSHVVSHASGVNRIRGGSVQLN